MPLPYGANGRRLRASLCLRSAASVPLDSASTTSAATATTITA